MPSMSANASTVMSGSSVTARFGCVSETSLTETVLSGHAGAVSVKDVSDTHPNLAVTLDSDITVEAFADIDGMAETVDRGGEGY